MQTSDIKAIHDLPKNSYLQYIRLFPSTKSEQVKSYFTLILTLLAIIGFSVFAISPTISTIVELRRKLDDSRTANNALKQKIKALDLLQTTYSTMGDTRERIDDTIPTSPEVPMLFAKLQTVAGETNVTIEKLESQEVEVTKRKNSTIPSSYTLTVSILGTYDQTLAFLNELKTIDRLVLIDSFATERGLLGGKQLRSTIRLRTFFHPEVTTS